MRRALPLCVLAIVLAYLSACGEAPTRPSVVTDRPVNPPKTSARYIQVPWDISLFFNLPGGAVVAGATTAATVGGAAEGDNLTGTYTNSTGFGGTLSGVLTGTLENGNFNGTLKTITASGCTAERQFSGPITTQTLNWTPGSHVNDCGGTSPLSGSIQVAAAPPDAPPPCTYSAAIGETSFAAAGGSGTITVTAGTGCVWFATSSAGFVTLSAGQGTGGGSVQYTVAANSAPTGRTATLVVAGQSFTINQAGVPAPVCTYALNDTGRTFDAAGGLGGVDMRAAAGCGWTATSDAPWLTFRSGASGSGNGAINFAVEANPGLSQRVGRITAQGQIFTVTQSGISCTYTATLTSAGAFPAAGGTGTATVATQAACAWAATSNVPWMTVTPPAGGTGNGGVSFTIAPTTETTPRAGVLTIAGQEIGITQAATPCTLTATPSQTAFPAPGGAATVAVVTGAQCNWTAVANVPWIAITPPPGGNGSGTLNFTVAATTEAAARTGTLRVGTTDITITQSACAFTATPSQTAFPEAGGAGTVAIVTTAGCTWTAVSNVPWITIPPPPGGSGNASVPFNVARNDGAARSGTMTIAGQTITITQPQATVGTLSGTITNGLSGAPVPGATVVVGNLNATTGTGGTYTLANVPLGTQTVRVSAPDFLSRSDAVTVAFQTTHSVPLTAGAPVLAFLYNANPVFPDETNRHCGEPENVWCWSYTNTLQNTGTAGLTVTAWEINLYNVEGGLEQHTIFGAADFPRFYGGATGVPAGGVAVGGGIVFFNSSSGGTIEIVIAGTDAFGRTYRFIADPRLSAQERFVELRRAAPGGARSTTAPPPRPRGGR